MALKHYQRKLTVAELNDPSNNHFWMLGGKLFRRFKGTTSQMRVGELVPVTLGNHAGALQLRSVTATQALLAIRLKKNRGRCNNLCIKAGTVVILHKGMRYMHTGVPPAEVLPMIAAERRQIDKAWLFEDRSAIGP